MRGFREIFSKGILGLTLILIVTAALPVEAAALISNQILHLTNANIPQSHVLSLAKNTEPVKEKLPSPAPPPPEQKKLRSLEAPPCPQLERMEKSVIRDEPGKAGTKKIGGQPIRATETLGGE